jgi:ferredoxin
MASGVRVEIDLNKCVGSTMCVQFADAVFALDSSGQAVVTNADGGSGDEIVDAAAECPMEAITVTDAATGEELFPGF